MLRERKRRKKAALILIGILVVLFATSPFGLLQKRSEVSHSKSNISFIPRVVMSNEGPHTNRHTHTRTEAQKRMDKGMDPHIYRYTQMNTKTKS